MALPAWSLSFLLAFLGLTVGSFLNVVAHRLPRGESLLRPRSRCPKCGHTLAAWDLVPVLSFLWLRGRCRFCRAPISPRYPAVELCTGAFFVAAGLLLAPTWQLLRTLALGSLFIAASLIDLDTLVLPDAFTLGGAALALLLPPGPRPAYLLGALAGCALLLFIAWASRGGMGGGDVKLGLALGAFLGWPNVLPALFLAFFLGAAAGIGLILAKKKRRSDAVPFGPFLVAGGLGAALWGTELLELYFRYGWR
ncbi:MAG TPA: prepilin peptidase [Firmicutes bacterium]|nr:prepilin peptidase [Bacillota bacterium]